jgi:FMNH2-dependent dimethyl sulfone monooxygenase
MAEKKLRYGYWMPVFGGWLRNVEDEQMETSWAYARRLTQRAERLGYDLSLIAELNLNDIKGAEAPSLDAWSTAAALAAVTDKLEIMVAVRPTFHNPALFAKQAANIDHISNGRLTLNVVSSWWADEATKYGIPFDQHDDRYARTSEWLDVIDGCIFPMTASITKLPTTCFHRSPSASLVLRSTPAAKAKRPRI